MHKIDAIAIIKKDPKSRLAIVNRAWFMQQLEDYDHNTKVTITIEKFRDKRSLQANSLLHVWIGLIAAETGQEDCEVIKDFLKSKFLRTTAIDKDGNVLVDPETGEVVYRVLKTADLDTKQFDEFMEKIRTWSLYFLNLDLTI